MNSQTPNKKTPSSAKKTAASGGVKKTVPARGAAQAKKPAAAVARKPAAEEKRSPTLAERVRNYNFKLRKQKYKFGTVVTVFTIAIITCVVLVNVLIGLITDRYGIKFDMTSDRRFAITSDTKNVLKDLDERVDIDVYMTESDFRELTYGNEMAEILNRYKVYGGDNINITYVDPLKNPTYADKYNSPVTISEGTVVVSKGEDFKAIPQSDLYYWYDANKDNAVGTSIERVLTTTILNLGLPAADKPTAAILYGHGELALEELGNQLADASYNVLYVNLQTGEIPDGVSLLVLNCPSTDYTEAEVEKIEAYLNEYKNMIFFYGAEVPKLANLEQYFKEWGVTYEYSMVCDSSYRVLGNYTNIVSVPTNTADRLVEGLNTNNYVVMPSSREMHPTSVKSSLITVTDLLNTSSVAYSKSLAGGPVASYEKEDGDTTGPFSTAILSSKYTIINNDYYYANVLFISSPYLYNQNLLSTESYGNQRFFTNILAKFNPSNKTVSISSKKYVDPELNIVGNELSVTLVLLCIVPAAALVAGLVVWRRRKNR
jgi:ABC-2 type transport system permease protein